MTCWALIPIKASGTGKSRLAEALDADARQVLVQDMLAHVATAAQQARAVSRVLLVGPSRLGLPEDISLLADPGTGLNPAIESAISQISASDNPLPERLLILFADLPEVTSAEIDLLAVARDGSVAIAPDRHEIGTNALSLPMTVASQFRFAFGEDSFARHRRECERLGLGFEVILSGGLERDVDEPADLPDAGARQGKS
ncbi:MAG: 2-phospho-L-lactate guanylyltransferase [Novosphingobium sp.]|nr:2-phospho-L-lactate guanylyltransferase [Novosphingobium sp.]